MMNSAVAKRYGQALLQIAQEKNALDDYQTDLKAVVDAMAENAELSQALTSQKVSMEVKKSVTRQVFAGKVDDNIVNLLCVVIDKGREEFIADIYSAYCSYADEVRNIAYADVRSAYPMTEEQAASLAAQLTKQSGKNVKLNVCIDESLVGGLVVTFGDKVYDGTVGARLEGIKNKLQEVQF